MNSLVWMLSLAATAGALLNIAKNPVCFVVWAITNTGFLAIKLRQRSWAEALLWSANLTSSLVGLAVW
jgi:hypothetical protein